MRWTTQLIATARGHWDNGLSAAAIGRKMKLSKDQIIGIAHRNGFTPRPPAVVRNYSSGQPSILSLLAELKIGEKIKMDRPIKSIRSRASELSKKTNQKFKVQAYSSGTVVTRTA